MKAKKLTKVKKVKKTKKVNLKVTLVEKDKIDKAWDELNEARKFGDRFLIYDANCRVCTRIAVYFRDKWDIKIVPNLSVSGLPFWMNTRVYKDVHYVRFVASSVILYSGSEAVAKMIGTKYPFVSKLYSYRLFRYVFDVLYYIMKKTRKYL